MKKETTSEWHVSLSVEVEERQIPDKKPVEELGSHGCVGMDPGVLNYIHTSDGVSVDGLNLEDQYERLEREQRKRVAKIKRHIRRKARDCQHKLTSWLPTEYEAVFVEDLDVTHILEQSQNARNKGFSLAWSQFLRLLEYKADLNGCCVMLRRSTQRIRVKSVRSVV
ncbi:MAG: transposase, IS605 OrfB family, central region [Haloquadratum walsbyi J07HQW2]|uniref:Transposase, IS605 OrfB family, central region n=1 Tax=Haloquadratum walsbyi J07HQW2 TaxID=1238425 RepID=U1MZL8_9EURY|nr:IS200/IS605 family element transposase accessory protein TnpB [Haloquadratum walsbyi]ERG95954.1 MAG: transposase, IS605 OrfB family, central region [Haloquadratum walsbyi J07HQW2]